ncbi:MAG: M48 family metallopeptidase [Lactobacillales bacterium]|jgi:heat shock protein HtpX|nr:M48 family metallopeptidase [Lactobacillales bacterium]
MYQDVKRNKRITALIISLFIVIIALLAYAISYQLDFGPFAIVIGLGFAIVTAGLSYYNSDKIVIAASGAKLASDALISREDYTKLENIIDGLMISSGLTNKPRLYIVPDDQPNAFATGRNPEHAVIAVTTGLVSTLDYYEMEAVIAHEMGHIVNYDIRLNAVVSVMVGFIVMISDFYMRTLWWGGGKSSKKSSDSKNGNLEMILMIIGLVLMILSPLITQLMSMAISRKREFMADAKSVELTRNPQALIDALNKISADPHELKHANKATAAMYIGNPWREKKTAKNWFSTHPSLDERIAAIEELK